MKDAPMNPTVQLQLENSAAGTSQTGTQAKLSAETDPRALEIFRIKHISKTFKGQIKALDDVSLDIKKGEIVALIGPSGCGKSTFLRCINGLETPDQGEIWFHQNDLLAPGVNWENIRGRIGMVFQSYELFPHLKVIDNLLLGPKLVHKTPREQALPQAKALLERVGLADRLTAYPSELSGGQKQRIAITRALMMNPEVLLLDEITASLDPEMVREVLDVVSELAREGLTMLIVTHEMNFAQAVANRVVFMESGQIKEIGAGEEFFRAPRSRRAQEFLNTFSFD